MEQEQKELLEAFTSAVWSHFKEAGRDFPWRRTVHPWGVLVSEVMLQQTQTERVVPYYERWMQRWPRPELLAAAPFPEVLKEWSGLGYNRRARYLQEAARRITEHYGGLVPASVHELERLPGIGPYTARAVACFAYNTPEVFIETNIRAAVLHFFFQDREGVPDQELVPILEAALDRERPREWYWALMDYGAALKKILPNPSRKSAHYNRQSPFKGSRRQIRGAILRILSREGALTLEELEQHAGYERTRLASVLQDLQKESFVAESEGQYRIASGAPER
ncbi:A/G-specific adenine glycosylase [Treponema sp. J25]|uniref:A/G-specific adenine glycosylase n=1 Tax=Treponema sp. J25 TaxID=2094121 RepID=UPI0010500043|nr:A/G-specific adenine glycosylase [Treponema sp. J25]TCW62330.1 endonuclease III [Treponema sp. J25]